MTNITANLQPTVSAIVPARNEEATIAACIESLAQQPEITEILVVNDHSTDRTAEIVRGLTRYHPQLRLIDSAPLPPGWVGKNHAVWQAAQRAIGDWLLFTDADVLHEKNSTARALEIARVQPAESGGTVTPDYAPEAASAPQLISFSPEQITQTWYEKSLIPVVYCRLAKKFDFDKVNDPGDSAAAANGQFLLISRAAYDAVGGHAAIASEILEDVALAKRVKAAGYRICFGPGQGIVSVRMYRTFSAMWEGWTKNLYQLMGGDQRSISIETALSVLPIIFFGLLVGLFWGLSSSWRVGLLTALLGLAIWHWKYSRELKSNHFSTRLTRYGLPGKFLYVAVLWASHRSHQKGRLAWKGREYPIGTPSASNGAAKK